MMNNLQERQYQTLARQLAVKITVWQFDCPMLPDSNDTCRPDCAECGGSGWIPLAADLEAKTVHQLGMDDVLPVLLKGTGGVLVAFYQPPPNKQWTCGVFNGFQHASPIARGNGSTPLLAAMWTLNLHLGVNGYPVSEARQP